MSTPQEIYAEVKPDFALLAKPLFELSERLLRERGFFLPHAAVLSAEGKATLVNAMCSTPGGFASSTHILPLLHQGLRAIAHEKSPMAVGVAEIVPFVQVGFEPTQAVKVLVEHSRGITMAFYWPYTEESPGVRVFGKTLLIPEPPAVKLWDP